MAGAGGDDEGAAGNGPTFPQGMSIPVLPTAPAPVSTIEGGLQGAARVVDTIGGAVNMATQVSGAVQGASAEQVLPGIAGGLGSALGGASTFVSGIDPGVSQALGVMSAASSLLGAGLGAIHQVAQAVEGLVSESNRHRVTFEFESTATPVAEWMVASWTLEERIGRPYCATIVLAIEDLDLDARVLLGENAKLTLRRGDENERVIGGIVQRVELGRTSDRARVVTVELVPALALLALRRDSRIFQDLDATDILDAVLGGALDGYAREIELRTNGTYLRREYCVQYGESDFAFAQRLMEEEGITYFFEPGSEGLEKLVIVDGPDAMPALLDDGDAIPFVEQRSETSDTEHVHELLGTTQMRTTCFALTDLDWTGIGEKSVIGAESTAEDAQGRARERYDHDRAVTLGPYRGTAYGLGDAKGRLATRREAHAAEARVLRGRGNVIRFTPGRTLTIEDHPIAELDGDVLLLAVSHRGHSPELHDLLGNARYAADDVSYECAFEAIPKSVRYRMLETTPKPRVHGMLSAIVVGANGQEIHSDPHRRVRIQMRWDRQGTFDERSSCFVRVMQSWAGAGFGALFLPRIGMEVAVAFLDGDPDRPMITGCLYNGDNPPPYNNEADWTKSALRTKSSPAGSDTQDHFNELRFEDAAGHEQIYVHAERDLDEDVLHDHTTHVSRNQTNNVDGNQTEHVGGNQNVHVRGDRGARVVGEEDVIVEQLQKTHHCSDHRHIVGGQLHQTVTAQTVLEHQNTREVHVKLRNRESYGGGREVAVTGDDQSSATGRKLVYADAGIRISAQNRHEIDLLDGVNVISPDAVRIIVGESVVSVSSNGHITISAASQLALGCGAASIVLASDGTIHITGPAGINLMSGATSVELAGSGVTTSATSISSTALADHTIVGSIVRIN